MCFRDVALLSEFNSFNSIILWCYFWISSTFYQSFQLFPYHFHIVTRIQLKISHTHMCVTYILVLDSFDLCNNKYFMFNTRTPTKTDYFPTRTWYSAIKNKYSIYRRILFHSLAHNYINNSLLLFAYFLLVWNNFHFTIYCYFTTHLHSMIYFPFLFHFSFVYFIFAYLLNKLIWDSIKYNIQMIGTRTRYDIQC